jgi:hypothetical protein
MPEIVQRSGNAIVFPAAILTGHPDDQLRNVSANSGTSRVGPVFGAIELGGGIIPESRSRSSGFPRDKSRDKVVTSKIAPALITRK